MIDIMNFQIKSTFICSLSLKILLIRIQELLLLVVPFMRVFFVDFFIGIRRKVLVHSEEMFLEKMRGAVMNLFLIQILRLEQTHNSKAN